MPFKSSAESIVEGQVMTIEKNVGDVVNQDDVVIVVETDKEVTKFTAPTSGTITKILVEKGATVKLGKELFALAPGAGKPAAAPSPAAPSPTPAAKAAPAAPAAPAVPTAKPTETPKAAKPAGIPLMTIQEEIDR